MIEQYGWGYDGNLKSRRIELKEHACSDEELGLIPGAETDGFGSFDIFESSYDEISTWKKKFKCVPPEDLIIWGDYNSAHA